METKQTAVEYLQRVYFKTGMLYRTDFEKAKQMEREQIVDAHFTGSGCNLFDLPEYRINSAYKAAHQYYGEKFGEK
mgnify:CR=1 FL=1